MSKMFVFVVSYSLLLIVLFITLCFLISNINPPEKPDTAKYVDTDYFMSANDMPSNDNIGYGLERAYDAIDAFQSISSKTNITILKSVYNTTEISKWRNETHTNCTEGHITDFKRVTKAIKPLKDLRRSINEDKQRKYENDAPRSLLLKIKGVDGLGRQGIEIKLISEKLDSKRSRKYRSSSTKIKTTSNSSKFDYLELDSDNSIRDASVVMAENGTFILNVFANSIAVIRENDTVPFEFEDNYKEYACDNNNHQEIENRSSKKNKDTHQMFVIKSSLPTDIQSINKTVATNMYTFHLMDINFTETKYNSITQNALMSTFSTENGEYNNYSTMSNSKGQHLIQQDASEQRTSHVQNETITQEIEYMVARHTPENVATVLNEANANDNLSNLVGLLIPEATASLPIGS